MFDDTMHARQAVEDLVDSGFAREDISLVARGTDEDIEHYNARGEDVSQGAGIGAALGGVGGLLVGLGALAIPGVGPVVAAGTIGSALAGAGIGALAGGLIGALVDAGIPDDHAEIYTEGVRRGGTLVMLDTTNEMAERAVSILNRHNPVDIQRRAEQWRQGDWTGFNPEAEPYTSQDLERERTRYRDEYATERDTDFETPLADEDVHLGERDPEADRVRGYSRLTEDRLEEDVDLFDEDVNIGRGDMDMPTTGTDFETRQDRPMGERDMPASGTDFETFEDRPMGEAGLPSAGSDYETFQDRPAGMGTHRQAFEDFDQDFRHHYQTRYGATGSYDYAMYRPHYQYGYELGSDERYRDRSWEDFEMEARREYEGRYPDTAWDDIKDAVREGWRRVTGR
jgi:hypothetical protein